MGWRWAGEEEERLRVMEGGRDPAKGLSSSITL